MSRARSLRLSAFVCLLALIGLASSSVAIAQQGTSQTADVQVRDQTTDTAQIEGDQKKGTQFVRLVRDKNDVPQSLDTAVTTYIGKNSKGEEVRVALLGAIHIGDKAYYQELSKRFEGYDALLYELVAPKDARPGADQESMYGTIARFLGLSDQLANIDYNKDNFVHADMSGDDFLKSMEERGESFIQMIFKAMGQAMAQQQYMQQQGKSGPSDVEILMAIMSGDKIKLKRAISPTFEDMEMSMSLFEGPEGSTIVTERNKVALDVLRQQIKEGKTNIGIFYGAGHFRDMEERLIKDFDVKLEKQDWIKAWNMSEMTPDK